MNALEITNLQFSYIADQPILKDISLQFDGQSVAIIGQNGAGKTTFVKLLKGLLRPSKGDILFKGVSLSQQTVAQIARRIGLVFQNPDDQIFKHRVLDEVMFGPLQMGLTKGEAEQAARQAISLLGLQGLEQINPYDLGLSDRKLVSIAAIVAMDTDVIIFDEPTIGQDARGKALIRSVMKQLQEQGKLVISILHDMDFVADTFDRAVVFSQGNVLLEGTVAEVFSQKELLEQALLAQPTTAQLCQALGYNRVFLTAKEFVDDYQSNH